MTDCSVAWAESSHISVSVSKLARAYTTPRADGHVSTSVWLPITSNLTKWKPHVFSVPTL